MFGMIKAMRGLGVEVDLFAPPDWLPGRSPFRRLLPALGTMASVIVRLRRYDALYVRAHPVAWPVAVLARLLNVPVIQEVNGKTQDILITHGRLAFLGRIVAFFQHSQYRNADFLAAVTPGIADWLAGLSPRGTIVTNPNGVDTGFFTPQAVPLPESSGGGPYAIMVSSFSRWHGIETLLKAVKKSDWPQELRVLLIGDGPERERLAGDIRAAGRIEWIGTVPFEQLPGYLAGAAMNLVLIESPQGRSDAGVAPLKLYEAMSSACPVIATDQPYQRGIVEDASAGIVIPAGDPSALSAAAARLFSDPELRMASGEAGRRFVLRGHDWKNRAATILKLLQL
ncbi:MAG: glycosyltransferase family 4 protein [Oricola sp.]